MVIVKVRGKDFNIELVSNYVHKLYAELTEASFKLSDCSRDAQEKAFKRAEQIKKKPKLEDLKAINGEFTNEVERLNELIKELTSEVVSKRETIIKELIDTNGYEYDSEWWNKRTSPDDMNDFMLTCLGKDQTDNKAYGKKK